MTEVTEAGGNQPSDFDLSKEGMIAETEIGSHYFTYCSVPKIMLVMNQAGQPLTFHHQFNLKHDAELIPSTVILPGIIISAKNDAIRYNHSK